MAPSPAPQPSTALHWLSPFLIWPLSGKAPAMMIRLIAAGGLIYPLGMPFCLAKAMPFSTALWHGIVVIASGCFLVAIAIGVSSLS
ncbi:hypothetical protein [Yoonia sp. MH D7]